MSVGYYEVKYGSSNQYQTFYNCHSFQIKFHIENYIVGLISNSDSKCIKKHNVSSPLPDIMYSCTDLTIVNDCEEYSISFLFNSKNILLKKLHPK